MTEESIFNSKGQIRGDLDKVKVPEDRRPALDALIAAQAMTEQVEAEYKAAETTLHAAVRRRNDIASRVPRKSFMEIWRENVSHPDRRGR